MPGATDVKSLLPEVDASVELLRRNLTRGDQAVGEFERDTRARLDRMDRRFEQLGGGLRQLPGTIGRARAEIATLGTSMSRVENQVRASTLAMRSALLSFTAAIGAVHSVNRVKEYADGYTRFTNQLKVAGLEGAALGRTQNDLYAIAHLPHRRRLDRPDHGRRHQPHPEQDQQAGASRRIRLMLVELPRYRSAPAEVQWKLRQPSQANRSKFTGRRRVTILAEAPRWVLSV